MLDKEQAVIAAQKFADAIAGEFNPKQILFFGSYLDGTPKENSDIDVAVVFDNESAPENWLKAASRMQAIRWEIDDMYVEPHLLRWNNPACGFTRHVQSVGKVLYQR